MVYTKVRVFIKEAGTVIIAISVILWFLSSHGNAAFNDLKQKETTLEATVLNEAGTNELNLIKTQKLEHSFIGQLGQFIEPAIRPLGFDWKIGIALITSFAAREVFVGTMATIYKAGSDNSNEGIKEKLLSEKNDKGEIMYTPAVCWSLLVFYAFALQCMSTIATVKRETKSWKWAVIQLVFMSALAYLSAFSAYQLLS